ncbi:hypothetical protein JTB14_000534 [Gonioctena quinquepunctata]|nr:hypothetical protein JTB14_000534 [Gonioctena quinquepunctata]
MNPVSCKLLDDNELKELIPSIGQRKTFTEALRKEDQAFVVNVPADITEYQLIDVINLPGSTSSSTSTKLWLGTRTDPWPEVIDKWRRTFEIRRKTIARTLASFFQEWPILKDPRSNTLIDIDYDLMYPESTINLHLEWLPFMGRLVSMEHNFIMKDKIASQYLELLKNENSDGI